MNRKEIIQEVSALDGHAIYENRGDLMVATIKNKTYCFKFFREWTANAEEELISVDIGGVTIFADMIKFRNGNLFFEQNGGVCVGKIV